jgi:CubicO group peptidase (beta-lactamase class C family)
MKKFFSLFAFIFFTSLSAQNYFPPTSGTQWDTVSDSGLGWCTSEKDTLLKYVESVNSRSFIILHKGRIVVEEYMNGFSADSVWYWASAGKSLMAFLIGMAQEDGTLNIGDKTSQYLGTGWTSAPQAKEDLITIWHQLTMTTGLDHNVPDQDCLEDSCLNYLHDAGSHWYYYNAPYRLTQDVLEAATGQSLNLYTLQSLTNATGIAGLWFNYVFFSRARDMARFGLLCLNQGTWDGTAVLGDTAYFKDMTTKSQNLNEAYGYLWWLNGSNSFKQPGLDIVFQGEIIPTAPSDLYMAAGKNDQRIYVVPSLDLVVVRQGEAANQSLPALSNFDKELWTLIMNYICPKGIGLTENAKDPIEIYPNPAGQYIQCDQCGEGEFLIISAKGVKYYLESKNDRIDISHLNDGVYFLWDIEKQSGVRFMKH